jgi:class 3 adenylate cyclase
MLARSGTGHDAAPPPTDRAIDVTRNGPAAAAGERRQATIVFADIVGYPEQCSRHDPEQVQGMLSSFFAAMDRVLEAYGGTVFERAGDAVMAVFGAPVAHGNDAQRAVRAALDMHAAAGLTCCDGQPLRLHIGLAGGEVVAATIRGAGTSKYSVTGDPVNLAARLNALAASGDTRISDALYRVVADSIDALGMGERALKGLAQPVLVWQVGAGVRAQLRRRRVRSSRDKLVTGAVRPTASICWPEFVFTRAGAKRRCNTRSPLSSLCARPGRALPVRGSAGCWRG